MAWWIDLNQDDLNQQRLFMDFNQHFYLHLSGFLRIGAIPLVDKHLKCFDLQQNRNSSIDLQVLLILPKAHFKETCSILKKFAVF